MNLTIDRSTDRIPVSSALMLLTRQYLRFLRSFSSKAVPVSGTICVLLERIKINEARGEGLRTNIHVVKNLRAVLFSQYLKERRAAKNNFLYISYVVKISALSNFGASTSNTVFDELN